MFETVKNGPLAGSLVRLDVSACAVIERPLWWQTHGLHGAIYSNIGTLYVLHGKARTIVNIPF